MLCLSYEMDGVWQITQYNSCQMHLRTNLWVHVSFNKHHCNIYSILTHAQSSMFWFSFSSNVFRRHNITVLSDEIYSRIRYDQNHVSLANVRILHNTEWLVVKWLKNTAETALNTNQTTNQIDNQVRGLGRSVKAVAVAVRLPLRHIVTLISESNLCCLQWIRRCCWHHCNLHWYISVLPWRDHYQYRVVKMGECRRMEGKYHHLSNVRSANLDQPTYTNRYTFKL